MTERNQKHSLPGSLWIEYRRGSSSYKKMVITGLRAQNGYDAKFMAQQRIEPTERVRNVCFWKGNPGWIPYDFYMVTVEPVRVGPLYLMYRKGEDGHGDWTTEPKAPFDYCTMAEMKKYYQEHVPDSEGHSEQEMTQWYNQQSFYFFISER